MERAARVYIFVIGLLTLHVRAVPTNSTTLPPEPENPQPVVPKPLHPNKAVPDFPTHKSTPILNIRPKFEYPTVKPLHPLKGNASKRLARNEDMDARSLTVNNQCGGNYDGIAGEVKSPKYPYSYAPRLHCKYSLTVPEGYQMGLVCGNFSLQPDVLCRYDYLSIEYTKDNGNITRQKFCKNENVALVSHSNKINMLFHTDKNYEYKGFSCTFRAMLNGTTVTYDPVNPGPEPPESPDLCAGSTTGDSTWSGLCGVENYPSNRIVGGEEMFPHQANWMVAVLRSCEVDQYCMICGGTIISEEWILTGAHCIEDYKSDQLAVLMGDHNLYTLTKWQKFMKILIAYKHPEFNIPSPLNNDVGLLKLAQRLKFNKYFAPVCLPDPENTIDFPDEEDLIGEDVVVMGWGTTTDGGDPSATIRQVWVPIIDNDDCDYFYGLMTDTMLCTSGENAKGPCQGDSGGPLLVPIYEGSDRMMQIGTMSFGASVGCDDGYPSGQASIFKFMDWIKFVTNEKFLI